MAAKRSRRESSLFVVYLLLLVPHLCEMANAGRSFVKQKDDLERVLLALHKVVEFFSDDYSSLNLDGLYGIRVAQGTLMETLRECQGPEFECPSLLIKFLIDITDDMDVLARNAIPYIQAEDPEYFDKFSGVVDAPYIVPYQPVRVSELMDRNTPKVAKNKSTNYNEDEGDQCFVELMGSAPKGGSPVCAIPDKCWTMMTNPNQGGYSLTHQLLYFIAGQNTGCQTEINSKIADKNKSLHDLEVDFCIQIYEEALKLMEGAKDDSRNRELFLEQSSLCGMLGFLDFSKHEWINLVIGWQSSSGCFTMSPELAEFEHKIAAIEGDRDRLYELLNAEAEAIKKSGAVTKMRTGRKLLREKVMKGDCLSHTTGLGVATFGTYVRSLVGEVYGHPDTV